MRVAVYWAPERADPLWRAGCSWLGWDPETGEAIGQPPVEGLGPLTESPRRYGFHATLKPPMRLATSLEAFLEDARALAAGLTAFALPPLEVAVLDRFLAVRETAFCPQLQALADACVEGLDRHREAEGAADRERRRTGLDARASAHLDRWGYPYVFDLWRFHLTLSERLAEPDALRHSAEAYFAPALSETRRVTAITIYGEAAPGARFHVIERLPLRSFLDRP